MARTTQHEFVSVKDTDGLIADLIAAYEKITGYTVYPSSPERLFIQWVAYILLLERAKTNRAGNSNLSSRAEAEDLDVLGEDIYNLPRPAAVPSSTTIRFNISKAQDSNLLIPKGTRITDPGKTFYWETDKDVYVKAGEMSADVPCTCQTAGAGSNGYTPGQINTLVDVFPYYTYCENITMSDGGADAPTDDEYYELMKESMNSWSDAGSEAAYHYWAKQVSTEIVDVRAKRPRPGHVWLFVLMKDGSIASEEVKKEVDAACNKRLVRPLTDYVTVKDPEQVTFNVNLTYYIQSDVEKSASEIARDVQDAVNQYVEWQQTKLGRDINPDRLREFVWHTGVKRMDIKEPVFTVLQKGTDCINDVPDESIPQVGKIGTITISSGGYEDE